MEYSPFSIKTILVVDDDESICSSLRAFLEDDNFSVFVAHNGEDGLKTFQEVQPDLLILDLNMPAMTGHDLLRHVTTSHPQIPKLVFSGVGDISTAMRTIHEGAWDFIPKPISDMTILLHKITLLEEKARLILENRRHREKLEQLVALKTADVKRLSLELINTQKEIVVKLADVIETRSNETGNHVRRVAQMSKHLAIQCGIDSSEAEILRLASPLHDVGKVGIPDMILNKPGSLTTAEFDQIKGHTTIGYNMLKNSKQPMIRAGAIIAHQHHERWDGSGYPQGLKGENIHIFGRITCVADVYDALRQKRHYKEPWSQEMALGFIKNKAGEIFDPYLADLFLRCQDDIEEMIRDIDQAEAGL